MVSILKHILPMTQRQLKVYLHQLLLRFGYNVLNQDGFLYGAGDKKVLLVSHMDTVHYQSPVPIMYDRTHKVMWSPNGIGGDDRCGVATIISMLRQGFRPHVLFTEDEEIGCIGAGKAAKALFPDVNFLVELDRRGQQDSVYYRCGNDEFKKYINSFGFIEAVGSTSDIVKLSAQWDIASVNLSVGYFNEHQKHEYIDVKMLETTASKVANILRDESDIYFEHMEVKYTYTYNYYDGYTKTTPAAVKTDWKQTYLNGQAEKNLNGDQKKKLKSWLKKNYPNGVDAYMVNAWTIWCDFCEDIGLDHYGFGDGK